MDADGNMENGTLFHNGIAAMIDAFIDIIGHYSTPLNHGTSATVCFHCKIHMNRTIA